MFAPSDISMTSRTDTHSSADLAVRIDALLPQTQCGLCGHGACKPYAEAIAEGRANIDQCPPGGDEGIRELAALLGVAPRPLNPAHGQHKAKALAVIDEARCIGCALCLAACPVDAIVGSAKKMHTVIATECTGCELCLPPCPVDCIRMEPVGATENRTVRKAAADLARERNRFRQFRQAREADGKTARLSALARTTGSEAKNKAAP